MKKYVFAEKSAEELAKEMNASLKTKEDMTPEEVLEDDAEGGYYQQGEGE